MVFWKYAVNLQENEHPYRNVICNFIQIALQHGCSLVNLPHIMRTPFPNNTSGWLLLNISNLSKRKINGLVNSSKDSITLVSCIESFELPQTLVKKLKIDEFVSTFVFITYWEITWLICNINIISLLLHRLISYELEAATGYVL